MDIGPNPRVEIRIAIAMRQGPNMREVSTEKLSDISDSTDIERSVMAAAGKKPYRSRIALDGKTKNSDCRVAVVDEASGAMDG